MGLPFNSVYTRIKREVKWRLPACRRLGTLPCPTGRVRSAKLTSDTIILKFVPWYSCLSRGPSRFSSNTNSNLLKSAGLSLTPCFWDQGKLSGGGNCGSTAMLREIFYTGRHFKA